MIKKKVRDKLLSSAKGCLYDNKRILDDWRRCEKLRTDQGFTMQKLSLGLCSAAIFSRIEAYEWDMDTMMALVTVPRILLGPAAGVFVDRYDRKKLIIFGDVIRGVSVLCIAFAAWNGFLEIWMVIVGGSDFRDLCLCVQSGDRIGASGYCSF